MACVYALRLPLRSGVSPDDILTVLAFWINTNLCNFFQEISFKDFSASMDIAGSDAQLSAARAVIDDKIFTAIRLQSQNALPPALPSSENMLLQAEFLLEEAPEGGYLTFRLHCTPLDFGKSAVLPRLSPPEVLWQLAEQGLLAPDAGLPLQQTPLVWSSKLEESLLRLRNGTAFSARPLLLVREGNYALTPKRTSELCQFVHVLPLPAIHPALSGLGAGSAYFLFPRFRISRVVDLTTPAAGEELCAYAARLSTVSLPGDLPDFTQIHALCSRQTASSAEYLCVNQRMADSIRFYRIKCGLTQAELAKIAGTTGLLISRLENNRPARVRESLVTALEEALHLTNGELFACERIASQAESAASRPVFCPVCGAKALKNSHFCHICGSSFS